jgi:glycosyltransferase involved in cell wall biosynthesis
MSNPSLRVGLDARVATLDFRGFGRYSRSLLHELIALPSRIEWFLYTHDPALKQIFPESGRVRIKALPGFLGLRSHLVLRSAARQDQIQLMYFLANNFWFLPACPTLITIHDTEPFEHPEFYCHSWLEKALDRYRKFRISRVGTQFITDSEASRKDAVSILKIAPEKIAAVYCGVDHALFQERPGPKDREIRARYIPAAKPYLFFVGAHDYRKNLPALIRAFDLLKKEHQIPHLLVLAGSGGADPGFYPPLTGIAKIAPQDIIFPGYISDQDLPALYRGAEVFVFPSLKEGFGLPVLEAMACGAPVVTSLRSSLPEVVGDAGLLVNPEKESDLADAIWRILSSAELAQSLRAKGLEQAAKFRWENTARQVLEVIERLPLS